MHQDCLCRLRESHSPDPYKSCVSLPTCTHSLCFFYKPHAVTLVCDLQWANITFLTIFLFQHGEEGQLSAAFAAEMQKLPNVRYDKIKIYEIQTAFLLVRSEVVELAQSTLRIVGRLLVSCATQNPMEFLLIKYKLNFSMVGWKVQVWS